MDFGNWTEDKKGSYNNWDAISRSTIEVDSHLQFVSLLYTSFSCLVVSFLMFSFRFNQGHGLLYLFPGITSEFEISEPRTLTDDILAKKHT